MNSVETHQLPDYYSVLKADPLAKIEQIEDLFRQLATEAQSSGDTSSVPQIIEAFEVLRDPAKRQQYDHLYFANAQAQQSQQQQSQQEPQQQQEIAAMPPAALIPETSSLTDQAPVAQAPVAQAPVAQAPVAQVPVAQMPVAQAPVAQVPVAQVPVAQVPVAQVPVAQAPVAQMPTEQVPVDQAPAAEQRPAEPTSLDVQETGMQETVVDEASEEAFVDGFGAGDVIAELSLNPEELRQHRRELLKIFYERRRKDVRKSGIAIGGLDSMVRYSYELLEFHLWIMSEKKVITREESGALSISSFGCEEHEQNIIDGLVSSSL